MNDKKALITGITGQDGSYLAELLLDKGYEVHGLVRRVALEDPSNKLKKIKHLLGKIHLHVGAIENYQGLVEIFGRIKPDECYHLAGQSFVHEPFEEATTTFMTNIMGTLNILNALNNRCPSCKFYFAGSSEMFGKALEVPQTETTRFQPRNPYGITRAAGFELTRNFREKYGIFACNGILFNHESPRRGYEFVTRKITSSIARIKKGEENVLILGNLSARRDWGYAKDYVEAMWLMLQQDEPDDYVIGTGETHTIKEFLDLAFKYAGLKYEIVDLHEKSNEEADEKIKELKERKEKIFVIQHPQFCRPDEDYELKADFSKARKIFKWEPKISFEELVRIMVESDIKGF